MGYRSCFYRSVPVGADAAKADAPVTLHYEETEKVFDPVEVYSDAPNPTKLFRFLAEAIQYRSCADLIRAFRLSPHHEPDKRTRVASSYFDKLSMRMF